MQCVVGSTVKEQEFAEALRRCRMRMHFSDAHVDVKQLLFDEWECRRALQHSEDKQTKILLFRALQHSEDQPTAFPLVYNAL